MTFCNMRSCVIIFLFSVCIISSCITQTQKELSGTWIINEMSANGKNVKAKFLSNTIVINPDFSCVLPVMKQEERHSNKEHGEWSLSVSTGETCLTITSPNSFFAGTYTVTPLDSDKQKRHFSKMGLRKDSTLIYCLRGSNQK